MDTEKDKNNKKDNKRDLEKELREELNLTPEKEEKVNELVYGIIEKRLNQTKLITIILNSILIIIFSLIFGNILSNTKDARLLSQVGNIDKNSSNKTISTIGNDLTIFRNYLDKFYLGKIDEKKVWEQAVKGYIKGAGDKYTEYFTEKEWKEFEDSITGEFKGIGIVMMVSPKNPEFITIVDVVDSSPAKEAGIKPNDLLIGVDDKEVTSENFAKISDMIKGKDNTKVKIKVLRGNETIEKTMERREVKAENAKSRMLTKDIGMISFSTFTETIPADFNKEYLKLVSKGMKKLVIDLRDNTGGELEAAKGLLDMFLDKGKVLFTTKNKSGKVEVIKSQKGVDKNIPIIILGNDYSASASEVVIGALVDNKRAKFVGVKTYGKGVIQTVIPLPGKGALKLTTEEYLRPNGGKINEVGIKPDVEVKLNKESKIVIGDEKDKDIAQDKQVQKAIELLNKKN